MISNPMMSTETAVAVPNLINGEWTTSSAAEMLDVINPATGEVIARTPLSSRAEVGLAVQAAADAFPAWRRTPPGERIQYLFKLKNLLEEHFDELAPLITDRKRQDPGGSQGEIRRGIENVEVACGIPMMMQGYNLEDVAPGIDETHDPAAAGRGGRDHAVQFSGDDSALVSALCDCVREHA